MWSLICITCQENYLFFFFWKSHYLFSPPLYRWIMIRIPIPQSRDILGKSIFALPVIGKTPISLQMQCSTSALASLHALNYDVELMFWTAEPCPVCSGCRTVPWPVPELSEAAEHGLALPSHCIPVLQCLNQIKWVPPA